MRLFVLFCKQLKLTCYYNSCMCRQALLSSYCPTLSSFLALLMLTINSFLCFSRSGRSSLTTSLRICVCVRGRVYVREQCECRGSNVFNKKFLPDNIFTRFADYVGKPSGSSGCDCTTPIVCLSYRLKCLLGVSPFLP